MSNDYVNQNASAPNITLAHAVNGSPVDGKFGAVTDGNVQVAGLHSMAPYGRPPKAKAKRTCSVEGCKGNPVKTHPYCMGHCWSLGLIERKKKVKDDDAG